MLRYFLIPILAVAVLVSVGWAQGVHVRCETDGAVTVCVNGNSATRTVTTEDSVWKDSITVKEAMFFFAVKAHKKVLAACQQLAGPGEGDINSIPEETRRTCDNAADWLRAHGYTCHKDGSCERTK